nr:hypothetical protein CFP56_28835 [Quercus suber]
MGRGEYLYCGDVTMEAIETLRWEYNHRSNIAVYGRDHRRRCDQNRIVSDKQREDVTWVSALYNRPSRTSNQNTLPQEDVHNGPRPVHAAINTAILVRELGRKTQAPAEQGLRHLSCRAGLKFVLTPPPRYLQGVLITVESLAEETGSGTKLVSGKVSCINIYLRERQSNFEKGLVEVKTSRQATAVATDSRMHRKDFG